MFQSALRLAAIAVVFTLSICPPLSAGLILAQANAADGDGRPKLVKLWQAGDPGQRMNIRGRVTAIDGTPLAGVSIYLRQADGNGDYIDRYSAMLETDPKGRYQFASVVPGQYYGTKHVHLWITQDGFRSLNTEILFKGDPNLEDPDAPNAIFLEEANVNGETILYGRFDIVLVPE